MEKQIHQLVNQHFEADRQAFINFIRMSYPLNGDEIVDLYNDVWIDVIENVRRGRTERVKNWKSYVFGLGWKRACKLITRRAEMDRIDNPDYCSTVFEAACRVSEEEAFLHMDLLERIEKLMEILEGMPERHRAVLEHFYIEGMSASDIAEAMGYGGQRTVITVKRRSLAILRERMMEVA